LDLSIIEISVIKIHPKFVVEPVAIIRFDVCSEVPPFECSYKDTRREILRYMLVNLQVRMVLAEAISGIAIRLEW
jgi:hypothetical protein